MNAPVLARGDAPGYWADLLKTRIGGIDVVTADREELVAAMLHDCLGARVAGAAGLPRLVFDLNGQGISANRTDPVYRQALAQGDVIHSDGGIWVRLSRYTGRAIKGRSCTTDMAIDFNAVCEREGLSYYILGGTEEINLAYCGYLERHYPKLRIAGRWNGYFGADEEAALIASINAAKPDILWVGMGKPREQVLSARIRDRIGVGWIVTCGGCYNYFVGGYTRAPLWMRDNGLEWLYRMAKQPSLFAWRYIKTNPHALALALWDLAKLRLRGGTARYG